MRHPACAPRYDRLFDPLTIGAVAASVGGSILQARATSAAGDAERQGGLARQQALEFQAKQARINAGQQKAVGQRGAIEQRRQGELIESAAIARGAASGVGGDSLSKVFGDIGAETDFRTALALFQGDSAARDFENQARTLQFDGEQVAEAGRISRKLRKRQAFGQVVGGVATAATFASKFGDFGSATDPRVATRAPTNLLR